MPNNFSHHSLGCRVVDVDRSRNIILIQVENCLKLLGYARVLVPFNNLSSSECLRRALTLRYMMNMGKLYLLEAQQAIVLFRCCDENCIEKNESGDVSCEPIRYQTRQYCRSDFVNNYVKNLMKVSPTHYTEIPAT